jgi:hypothetical protein
MAEKIAAVARGEHHHAPWKKRTWENHAKYYISWEDRISQVSGHHGI